MKTIYLSSKGTKLNQIIIFVTAFIIFISVVIWIIPYNKITIKEIIEFLIVLVFWFFNVYLLTKFSEAKLVQNKIIYKKLFLPEKHFYLNEIIKINIVFKQFVSIKYSRKGKEEVIWIHNKEKLMNAFDTVKIIKDAKRDYEQQKNKQS